MRYRFSFLAIILFSVTFAQKEVEVFKKKSPDYPQFIYERTEYDSLIFWNKQMPLNALNGYYSAKAKISFTVDSLGNVKDISVSDFEMQKLPGHFTLAETPEQVIQISSDLKNESKRLVSLTSGLWTPAKEDNRIIEKRLLANIYFNAETERKVGPENIEMVNEDYLVKRVMTSRLVKPNEGYKQTQLFNVAERRAASGKQVLANIYYLQAARYNQNKIANTPGDVDAYYDMGVCYAKLKDYTRACKCWKACVNMGDVGAQEMLDKYCK